MPGRIVTSTLLCMIGLSGVGPALSAENAFDGVYTGKRVLTKGLSPACPTEEDVSVAIHGAVLTFTSGALHNFALGFDPHPDGSFGEIYNDIGGTSVLIRGRIVGDVLEADVSNGPCEHHWYLKRGQ